jgi:hypothetical protein
VEGDHCDGNRGDSVDEGESVGDLGVTVLFHGCFISVTALCYKPEGRGFKSR